MRFGLVRMIHGEEDFEDSDSEIDGDGGGSSEDFLFFFSKYILFIDLISINLF